MRLTVYGDFNCPYSALASARADTLLARGTADVEWRAVEHAPEIPGTGEPVTGELADELRREVEEVHGLVRPGESIKLRPPMVRSNTASAVAAYAALQGEDAHEFRRRAFRAVWDNGSNVSGAGEVRELGGDARDEGRAGAWRDEWLGFEKRLVPMLVLEDGYTSRGLGALKRLADLADDAPAPS